MDILRRRGKHKRKQLLVMYLVDDTEMEVENKADMLGFSAKEIEQIAKVFMQWHTQVTLAVNFYKHQNSIGRS